MEGEIGKWKKPCMSLDFATTVGIGSMLGGFASKTEAESLSNLKKKQEEVKSQQTNVDSNINDANQKISNIQGQQADVQSQMERIDIAIGDTNAKIRDKSVKIEETKAQIAKLQDEIKVIQDRIQKRNLLLKDRARNYQENGGMVNYLDVLMGSTSFSDFVDRASAVATIMQADQDILKQAEADKQELEQKQTQVKNDLASLQKLLNDLQAMNNQLNAQRAEKDKLMASLKVQEKQVIEEKMSMQEQAQVLAAQNSAIQKAIKDEQDRQAEEARKAEQARQAAAAAAKSTSGGSSTSAAAAAPAVSGGAFTRPAPGVITSPYGARGGEFHYGVDIAQRGPNVPIVAAADGVVVTSHYSRSYGNVVYIAHSINGQVYTTVYAHMDSRLVSAGQTVKKGQQIGIMGNTGESFGQHLHFELYRGPWAYHSAVNPMGIVPI